MPVYPLGYPIISGKDQLYAGTTVSNVLQADPLAQFTWVLRLQTHTGNNVPIGMWQNLGKTIPAVADNDPVAVWEDVLTATGQVTAGAGREGLLKFVSGTPTIQFDGVLTRLDYTQINMGDTGIFFSGLKSLLNGGVFGNVSINRQVRYQRLAADVLSMFDGTDEAISSDLGVGAGNWFTATWKRAGGTASFWANSVAKGTGGASGADMNTNALGVGGGAFPGSLVFASVSTQSFPDASRAIVENYVATLLP